MFSVGHLHSQVKRLCETHLRVDICFDARYEKPAYTSSSWVIGHVEITALQDVKLDSTKISLLGTSHTALNDCYTPIASTHLFLRMDMPNTNDLSRNQTVLKEGATHTVPFLFVIPEGLTINACNHEVMHDSIKESHLQIPPSLGPEIAGDKFSPSMANVSYRVRARVSRLSEGGKCSITEKSQTIRVLPAYPEQAPLAICKQDMLYRMSRTAVVRQGLAFSKAGVVQISAHQPSAAMLHPDGEDAAYSMARLQLVFKPVNGLTLPPSIKKVSCAVTAVTYSCALPLGHHANLGEWVNNFGVNSQRAYRKTIALAAYVEEETWQRIGPGTHQDAKHITERQRLPSKSPVAYETESVCRGKETDAGDIYYVAKLLVRVELPCRKLWFAPSFQSCIVSRAYVLQMTTKLIMQGANISLTLKVPLQIGMHSSGAGADPSNRSMLPESLHTQMQDASHVKLPAYSR